MDIDWTKKGWGELWIVQPMQLTAVVSRVPTAFPILKRPWWNHPEKEAVHVKEMSKRAPPQPSKKQPSCYHMAAFYTSTTAALDAQSPAKRNFPSLSWEIHSTESLKKQNKTKTKEAQGLDESSSWYSEYLLPWPHSPLVYGLFLKHSGILSHGALAHLFAWKVLSPDSSTPTASSSTCFKPSLKSPSQWSFPWTPYLKYHLSTLMCLTHLSCFICFSLGLTGNNTTSILLIYVFIICLHC